MNVSVIIHPYHAVAVKADLTGIASSPLLRLQIQFGYAVARDVVNDAIVRHVGRCGNMGVSVHHAPNAHANIIVAGIGPNGRFQRHILIRLKRFLIMEKVAECIGRMTHLAVFDILVQRGQHTDLKQPYHQQNEAHEQAQITQKSPLYANESTGLISLDFAITIP